MTQKFIIKNKNDNLRKHCLDIATSLSFSAIIIEINNKMTYANR